MSPHEIASRLRQQLAKTRDSLRLGRRDSGSFPAGALTQGGRFFFDEGDLPERIRLMRRLLPDWDHRLVQRAEHALQHRFSLLGYGVLDYGPDIDWQADIVSGKRAPLTPWPQVKLDFEEVGDCKVTWELNRHQVLPTLAKAWLLTGDGRFVGKLEALYYDWHRKNPYPLGINWASSLEVAFRSLSWIWVSQLLKRYADGADLRSHIVQALAFNASYIRRYLSTYFSPNTHLLGEAVALFFIGTLWPSLPGAAEWCETGKKIIVEHACTKVLADGGYFERSTYYHVYALDFLLHARILAERNAMVLPPVVDDVLKRMLTYLSLLCQAGPPPRFGDDDGGRVFDGSRNRAENLRDPLAIGTAFYGVNGFMQPGVELTEEAVWLLGEHGLGAIASCRAGRARSASLPDTGLYVSAGDRGARSQVVMDLGPLGGGSGGHGHADALSLTLNLDGMPMLVDPGTCSYINRGSDRDDFRSTAAHNTLTIDGRPQVEPRGPFSWADRWPRTSVEYLARADDFDLVAASHDGYAPASHRRTLFSAHEGYWLVIDEIGSNQAHDYALHWHLAPGSRVEQHAADRWLVERGTSRLFVLIASHGWSGKITSRRFSEAYGAWEIAPTIKVGRLACASAYIATLICSATLDNRVPTLASICHSPGVHAYCLTRGTNRSTLVCGNLAENREIEGWSSNGRFLMGSVDAAGNPVRVVAVESSFVRYRGELLQSAMRR